MQPIWLKSYPPGVPTTVNVDEYRSIGDIFTKTVEKFGARPAFVNMGTAISYSELDRLSRNFGAYLQNVLKLHRGARIALMMPNLLQYPVAMFGALRSGYTVVNCNPLYSPRELSYQLKDSGAEAIVIVENFANVLTQASDSTQIKHIITTDTVPIPEDKMSILEGRISIVSVAGLLGEVIQRAHEGRSVGEMFNE